MSRNTAEVLRQRYLLKDKSQNPVETPAELFRRVARAVAQAERNYASECSSGEVEEEFYWMMRSGEFLPNSPTLMNAGTKLRQLSACFVIPVEDSIDGIFQALKYMARIHQTGGGTGFSFSHLRPKGELVSTTRGQASGPVSFMKIFDEATGVIMQGGRRRGANMGILSCDHPDIAEFIMSKADKRSLSNFNISVSASDNFLEAARQRKKVALRDPRSGKKTREVEAADIFSLITQAAWSSGDPGLIFIDEINRRNPTPLAGMIEATNPCGELPLLPYESCNLASINLSKTVKDARVDWERLRNLIHWGVRFLDDVIEVNRFPIPKIKRITIANRKIGLGVMGFADMLIKLGIPYGSSASVGFAAELMRFVRQESLRASAVLAQERGAFPNYRKSLYSRQGLRLRNAAVNTIAPTGTISMIAGCSSGIEPLFAISFSRNVLSGSKLYEVNPIFEETAKKKRFYSKDLMDEIASSLSLRGIKGIPQKFKRLFLTAFDVSPLQHLRVQAAFQRFTDNSVSKTINLPNSATVSDVEDIFFSAHRLKCKGITIYRYGSRDEQVLSVGDCDQGACAF